jgi:regulatory protein
MDSDKASQSARKNAYLLLRQRPRSEYEIRNRLKMKGYGPDVIDGVVDGLRKSGEIDDARFARLWIESRMHMNPVGDVVLKHELREKGVGDEVIDAALDKKAADYDESAIALAMARERFEQLRKIDRRRALKRVYDFLLRRGFKYDVVRGIIEELR